MPQSPRDTGIAGSVSASPVHQVGHSVGRSVKYGRSTLRETTITSGRCRAAKSWQSCSHAYAVLVLCQMFSAAGLPGDRRYLVKKDPRLVLLTVKTLAVAPSCHRPTGCQRRWGLRSGSMDWVRPADFGPGQLGPCLPRLHHGNTGRRGRATAEPARCRVGFLPRSVTPIASVGLRRVIVAALMPAQHMSFRKFSSAERRSRRRHEHMGELR